MHAGCLLQLWTYSSTAEIPADKQNTFEGTLQPGIHQAPTHNYGNPAPLGLGAFALSTFILAAIGLKTQDITNLSIVIAPALGFSAIAQIISGIWLFVAGNTFGATTTLTFSGFWVSLAIILIPDGFRIQESYDKHQFNEAFGLYLVTWGIMIFIFWTCTLKSTVPMTSLYMSVWLAFFLQGAGYLLDHEGMPQARLVTAGSSFAMIASWISWWMMWTGLFDRSTGFCAIPTWRLPWSEDASIDE